VLPGNTRKVDFGLPRIDDERASVGSGGFTKSLKMRGGTRTGLYGFIDLRYCPENFSLSFEAIAVVEAIAEV
jgi:hypothetical protein